MTFGQALEAIKDGACVARQGWNGKGMFIFSGIPRVEVNRWSGSGVNRHITAQDGAEWYGCNYSGPVLCMKTAQDTIVVGWLASQTDMLGEDWEVVSD